jgi:hypothetical protein
MTKFKQTNKEMRNVFKREIRHTLTNSNTHSLSKSKQNIKKQLFTSNLRWSVHNFRLVIALCVFLEINKWTKRMRRRKLVSTLQSAPSQISDFNWLHSFSLFYAFFMLIFRIVISLKDFNITSLLIQFISLFCLSICSFKKPKKNNKSNLLATQSVLHYHSSLFHRMKRESREREKLCMNQFFFFFCCRSSSNCNENFDH